MSQAKSTTALVILGLAAALGLAGRASAQPADAVEPVGVILNHGPIHEAFAAPVSLDPRQTLVVGKAAPPVAVPELPPSERPATAAAVWIPGYWGWDESIADFVWVSGVWRVPPPHKRWQPGYWTNTGDGHRWVPGFWTSDDVRRMAYLPDPQARIVENRPATRPAGGDFSWVPGYWVWTGERYEWRRGHWARIDSDRVWVPDQLISTPRGVLSVPGYWDYPLSRRGLLFAAIDFGDSRYYSPGRPFSPSVLIRPTALSDQMFVWPRYHHYYFGDYFGPQHVHAGIRPWFEVLAADTTWSDPLFAHQQFLAELGDPLWVAHLQERYRYLTDNPAMRPRRTLSAEEDGPTAVTLRAAIVRRELPFRFEWISPDERLMIARTALSYDGLTPAVPPLIEERVVNVQRPVDSAPALQVSVPQTYVAPVVEYPVQILVSESSVSTTSDPRGIDRSSPRHDAHTAHQPYEQTQNSELERLYREPYLRRLDAGSRPATRPNMTPIVPVPVVPVPLPR